MEFPGIELLQPTEFRDSHPLILLFPTIKRDLEDFHFAIIAAIGVPLSDCRRAKTT
jgi:hypothetical protein